MDSFIFLVQAQNSMNLTKLTEHLNQVFQYILNIFFQLGTKHFEFFATINDLLLSQCTQALLSHFSFHFVPH